MAARDTNLIDVTDGPSLGPAMPTSRDGSLLAIADTVLMHPRLDNSHVSQVGMYSAKYPTTLLSSCVSTKPTSFGMRRLLGFWEAVMFQR